MLSESDSDNPPYKIMVDARKKFLNFVKTRRVATSLTAFAVAVSLIILISSSSKQPPRKQEEPALQPVYQDTTTKPSQANRSSSQAIVNPARVVSTSPVINIEPLLGDYVITAPVGDQKDLIVKQAAMVFPILNDFIDLVDPKFQLTTVSGDKLVDEKGKSHLSELLRNRYIKGHLNGTALVTAKEKLKKVFSKFGSDKAKYGYESLYAPIFHTLSTSKNVRVLEVGVGTNNSKLVSNVGANGKPGASLRAMAEYLPSAQIFGADVDKNILFNTNRISTTFANQLDSQSLRAMYQTFGSKQFDIVIDDALHSSVASFNQLSFAFKNTKRPGWIIIEDIWQFNLRQYRVIDYLLRSKIPRSKLKTFMWSARNGSHVPGGASSKPYLYVLHLL